MTELRDLTIGTATPADAVALLGLINLVQPHVPWDRRHLDWQFFEPPSGHARLYVVRDADEVVALYSAIPQRVWTGAATAAAWMVQDVMTHPAYRGRGFLHQLGVRCLDEIRADGATGYTFPNKLSEGSFRRSGWTEAGLVPRRSAAVRRTTTSEAEAARVEPLAGPFGEVDTACWQTAHVGTGVHRDAAFLEWRYRKPGAVYERFRIDGDRGFLVLKRFTGAEGTTVHVCDLVVRADARDLLDPVLAFTHHFAGESGAQRLTAWLPSSHPYAAAFERAGLHVDMDHDRYMFLTGAHASGPWHVSQGDSDVY